MMDIKSQISPKGLEFKSNQFIISDKYSTILTVVSYPKFIQPGYLSNLTNMSGIKMVIKHTPTSDTTARYIPHDPNKSNPPIMLRCFLLGHRVFSLYVLIVPSFSSLVNRILKSF